jgi:hypothetical protein
MTFHPDARPFDSRHTAPPPTDRLPRTWSGEVDDPIRDLHARNVAAMRDPINSDIRCQRRAEAATN